ncbi:MAG: pyridoxamine 5'-phosphate oxidase family protein [Rivihabitans pingtungensis]
MTAFHAGEQALQALHGQRERLAEVGARVVRPAMPDAHRAFFAELPWLLAGAVDADGQPWASALCGAPGFIHSPEADRLDIAAPLAAHDPLRVCLRVGARIGLLGLQPHSRRRNRANGQVAALTPQAEAWRWRKALATARSTSTRAPSHLAARRQRPALHCAATLDARAQALIRQADTCFIASAHPDDDGQPAHGVDVSHRGGPPGFVQVVDEQRLWLPDYSGNGYFNTLGNLHLHPRARGCCGWILSTATCCGWRRRPSWWGRKARRRMRSRMGAACG